MSCWVRPRLISCCQKRQEEMIFRENTQSWLLSMAIKDNSWGRESKWRTFWTISLPLRETPPGLVKILWPKTSILIRTLFLFVQGCKKHLLYNSRLGGLHRETMIQVTLPLMWEERIYSQISIHPLWLATEYPQDHCSYLSHFSCSLHRVRYTDHLRNVKKPIKLSIETAIQLSAVLTPRWWANMYFVSRGMCVSQLTSSHMSVLT